MEIRLIRSKKKEAVGAFIEETVILKEDPEGVENEVVNIYPELESETFEGFGGAVTDSAAYVYSLMNEKDKEALMQAYFGEDGLGYRLVRTHMDSCDFSTRMYDALSEPDADGRTAFSFQETERYIIPMLKDAQKAAGGKLELMLSPWSPPAFLKTNNSRKGGGHLKPEYAGLWAECICRYIEAFQMHGLPVRRISIQNEAKAVQTWDSCLYSAAQEREFLENHLYPALLSHGLSDIEVFIWDHNKERAYERTAGVMKGAAAGMVSGVACHWYSGDHFENLELIRKTWPDLKLIISESCIEYSKFSAEKADKNAARLSHEIIGDLNHGVTAFYDWNILLDGQGGPNHAGNFCQAPFLYDTKTKKLLPQKLWQHYYHFSHFIHPGARRLAVSRYTAGLDVTAFKNPGGEIVFVLLNRTKKELPVTLRIGGRIAALTLEKGELCSGRL